MSKRLLGTVVMIGVMLVLGWLLVLGAIVLTVECNELIPVGQRLTANCRVSLAPDGEVKGNTWTFKNLSSATITVRNLPRWENLITGGKRIRVPVVISFVNDPGSPVMSDIKITRDGEVFRATIPVTDQWTMTEEFFADSLYAYFSTDIFPDSPATGLQLLAIAHGSAWVHALKGSSYDDYQKTADFFALRRDVYEKYRDVATEVGPPLVVSR